MYLNWCFLVVYGFQILGIVPNVIAWMLVAATFGQLVLCIMSFFRQIIKKRALYVILTVIILFITVEMFLNGLLP
jgi:hypothetical protein